MFPDYYKQLGLTPNATRDEIKKAYRKLALEFHPDRDKSPDAHDKFIAINEAYLILYDEEAKAKYDIEYIIHFHHKKKHSQNEYKYSDQKNKEKEWTYERENHFDDADLNDWSKKAKQQGNEYARMAFDEFSKLVLDFVKEAGFQLGNTILVFFGLVFTMGGCGDILIGLSTSGEIGNPILGIIMLPIGILLFITANKNWDKHKT